jgi:hypothetical protein
MLLTSPDQDRAEGGFDNVLTSLGQSNVLAWASVPPGDTASGRLPSRSIDAAPVLASFSRVILGTHTSCLETQSSIFVAKSEIAWEFGSAAATLELARGCGIHLR